MTGRREVTTPEELVEDESFDPTLRPRQLVEFVGQERVREALQISIQAAR